MTNTISTNAPMLLVLTGFMGAGKTSVGQAIAKKLGREFVDMDIMIEKEAGMSIPKIFERHGEAYFRAKEAEWCSRLAAQSHFVVATGAERW